MNKPRITVYTPESSLAHPLKMVRDMWADIFSGRGLALRLAIRDIKAQYRQTFLGILWALIDPDRRCVHDILSGTRVERVKVK